MDATAPEFAPERSESFGSDLAGIFSFLVDPQGAARRLPRRWFWIAPILFSSVITILYMLVSGPMLQQYMTTAPMPANMNPDQYAGMLRMQTVIYKVMTFAMPLFIALIDLIFAALLLAVSSMLAIRVTFLKLFNLVAGCGVILALQSLAWIVILKLKHEISSPAELKPPLGLDIFLPEGTNKLLMGVASYFSLFQIWNIVMMILVFSIGFRVSKGKAAVALAPAAILGLLFTVLGAVFQK